MKRRFLRAFLAAIAWAGLLTVAGAARAQEIQLTGPLTHWSSSQAFISS